MHSDKIKQALDRILVITTALPTVAAAIAKSRIEEEVAYIQSQIYLEEIEAELARTNQNEERFKRQMQIRTFLARWFERDQKEIREFEAAFEITPEDEKEERVKEVTSKMALRYRQLRYQIILWSGFH